MFIVAGQSNASGRGSDDGCPTNSGFSLTCDTGIKPIVVCPGVAKQG